MNTHLQLNTNQGRKSLNKSAEREREEILIEFFSHLNLHSSLLARDKRATIFSLYVATPLQLTI